MDANRSTTVLLALTLAVGAPLAGCVGDTAQEGASGDEPYRDASNRTAAPPADPSTLEELSTAPMQRDPDSDHVGGHVVVDDERDLLFSGSGAGLEILDVSDPTDPTPVAHLDEIRAHDVDLLDRGNRTLAVVSTFSQGIHVVDVSDPLDPRLVTTADEHTSDNLAAVPGTPYVYVGVWAGTAGVARRDAKVEVLDLSTPSEPAWQTIPFPDVVDGTPTTTDGCHAFDVRPDLGLALCAGGGSRAFTGGGATYVWDIGEDPTDPAWLSVIDDPAITLHHSAVFSPDGQLAFVGDESYRMPNCNGAGAGDERAGRQPTGGLWIYDVSDPANPAQRGYVQLADDEVHENCTTHFGDPIDDEHVAWSWYQGGTVLVDVSDPSQPVVEDTHPPANTTVEALYHEGHVYASSAGTLQVLKLGAD